MLRQRIHDHYRVHDGENRDLGVEMDLRYKSPVNFIDEATGAVEAEWDASRYTPSTFPGHRAPHVFLKDGRPIFDLYGKDYTLVEFSDGSDRGAKYIVQSASEVGFPLKHIALEGEEHAYKIWGKRLVIVRPDGHVSWRNDSLKDEAAADEILQTISGAKMYQTNTEREAFTVTGSDVVSSQSTTFMLEKMGDLQT